ncbi:sulfite exporter TauE/SafE family protein [Brevundimonas sp. AJA228-03]|uniref:sulfite exporter TauE/SafE family protein n=1 Tax=Brevundimonas sp. AJA228-03 TaxID=2752515 RepID=UPI001AE057D2|nr:sulfite exporter TauE/SafE family protein [Brevundimonas sp. AJA228-03]QTN20129.1 sulfite exporter TauE/SafE family protein [Brevundimonas sp. AJA228-03]
METFLLFLVVGLFAQAVDGALGMAYGVISSSVLLAFGVPPATASASVHGAEVFTTAASAGSHIGHRNVEWRLLVPLAVAGVIGGVLGAYVLAGIKGDEIKPFVIAYLALMGGYILWRATQNTPARRIRPAWIMAPLGIVGGFFDAIGGGGWGPTVSSTLVGAGAEPRRAIGTANTAEFFVTVAISATFVWALVTGHWKDAEALTNHAAAVAGLVVGGLLAAPFAGYVTRIVPQRALTYAVGGLLLVLATYQGLQLADVL